MKGATVLVATAGLLVVNSEAIRLVQRDRAPAVVGFGIQRKAVSNPVKRDQLRQRRSTKTVLETLDNEETLYYANVSLGTPPQKLRLHIDTGSSDLWTNAASSTLCDSRGNPCSLSGIFNPNASSTYKYLSSDFNITYVGGSGATGDYVTDTLRIGDVDLADLQFGIGYKSTSPQGILGIGYDINEVQVNRNGKPAYPNVPQLLANDGYIQSNAYSLWLNDLVSSTGSILFGGVNTGKFHGQLQTLPVLSVYGVFAEFLITLTGLGITLNGKGSSQTLSSNSLPTAVLLDSGTTLTYLPDQVTQAIFNEVGAQYDPAAGAAYVPCSLMNNATTIDFTFSSPVISIPMKELVLYPRTNAGGSPITFKDGTPACIFGISPAGGSTAVMGDTFIRSAYVVYDIANNEISLAQTNFNSTETHILEISAGPSGVPGARRVSNPVTAVATATGGARISTPSTTASVISGSDTTIAYLPFVSVAGIACAVLLFAF